MRSSTLLVDRYQGAVEPRVGLTYAEAASYVDEGGDGRLVAHLVDMFMHMKDDYEFVLVIGTDFTGPSPSTELALNARLAANMGDPRPGRRRRPRARRAGHRPCDGLRRSACCRGWAAPSWRPS